MTFIQSGTKFIPSGRETLANSVDYPYKFDNTLFANCVVLRKIGKRFVPLPGKACYGHLSLSYRARNFVDPDLPFLFCTQEEKRKPWN